MVIRLFSRNLNPIRNYRRYWRCLSPTRRQEVQKGWLIVFAMSPFLLLMAELPLFVPDTTISDVTAILLGVQVPMVGLSTRIKLKELRYQALVIGFVSIFLLSNALLLSKIQTGFKILSTGFSRENRQKKRRPGSRTHGRKKGKNQIGPTIS